MKKKEPQNDPNDDALVREFERSRRAMKRRLDEVFSDPGKTSQFYTSTLLANIRRFELGE